MRMPEPIDVAARLRAAGCVWAEEEAALILGEERGAGDTERMIARRAAGEPLETVVGWAGFCGLRVTVVPGVFVPRRRTEALAREAVRRLPALPSNPIAGARVDADPIVAVDLCCGVGAIGAALLSERPDLELHAADADPRAAEVAARNLPSARSVSVGDLFDPLPPRIRGRIALIAANVPYVPSGRIRTLPAEARDFEPALALDGGADGLDVLRRVLVGAAEWLAPGGCVLSELDAAQVPAALTAAQRVGLSAETVVDDEREATVLVALRPV